MRRVAAATAQPNFLNRSINPFLSVRETRLLNVPEIIRYGLSRGAIFMHGAVAESKSISLTGMAAVTGGTEELTISHRMWTSRHAGACFSNGLSGKSRPGL